MAGEEYGVPQAPEIRKEWRLTIVQKVGMPLLFLIPLLALMGLFGPTMETARDEGETLSLQVTYPARFRYETVAAIDIVVTNISAQTAPTITVSVDQGYLAAFSNVSFQPSVHEITEEEYIVQLSDVGAGESRRVRLEIEADAYWQQQGVAGAAAGDAQAQPDAAVAIETVIFP